MPATPKQQLSAKRPSEKQDPDIGQEFVVAAHAKVHKDIGRYLREHEKYYKEIQVLKAKLKQKSTTISDLQTQYSRVKAELGIQSQDLSSYAEQNSNLKVDLLKHQPTNQLADSEIVEHYKLLHENISSWVDTELRRFEDQWRVDHGGQYPPQSDMFRHGNNSAYAEFLGANHMFGGEYLIESHIHRQLHNMLFNSDELFVALSKNEMEFIQNIETGLAKLDPSRDVSDVRYLRSEVLKGFAASPLFHEHRTVWMSRSGVGILRSTEKILPELSNLDDLKRVETFQHRVLEPAFSLAVAIKSSSVCYEFTERITRETQLKTFPLRFYHWNYCTMINIDTRQIMKKKERGHAEDKAIGAEQVLLLAPGLVRRSGEEIRNLTQETVCVKVDPLGIMDDDVVTGKEDEGSDMVSGQVAHDSSSPSLGPPKKKQKGRNYSNPIDLDMSVVVQIDESLDRSQRPRTRREVYGLHRDDGKTPLD
ncbi:MAG: hypothetical protein Q9209_001522 [Squamulea sp. 1 TL-2023]